MAEMDISKDVSIMENSDNKHNEILLQENHSLKKKIGNLEYLVNVLKEDNDSLQKEKSNLCDTNEEEKSLSSKLKIENKRLENNLDDVKNEFGKYKEDVEKEKSERTKVVPAQSCSCKSNNNNEDTLLLTFELNDVKFENEKLKSDLERCEQMYQLKINHLNENINSLQSEFDEMKQLLKNKTQQFSDAAASLEAVKEEKLILSSELAALKASPADVNIRGNSLFAEVEDKRKEMGSKLKMMYTKYMQLKRSYLQKNNDLRRLKEDYVTLQQRISDDEEMRVKADKRLIAAQDATIKDLQKTIRILEKRPETPQIVTLKDDVHFAWVQGIVDIARKEAAELRTELHLNSVNQWLLEQEIHKKTSELLQSHDKVRELTAEIARCKLNNEQFTGNDTETIASTSVTNMNSKKSTNQEKVVLRENNSVQNDVENILPAQKRTVQFKEIEN